MYIVYFVKLIIKAIILIPQLNLPTRLISTFYKKLRSRVELKRPSVGQRGSCPCLPAISKGRISGATLTPKMPVQKRGICKYLRAKPTKLKNAR